MSDHGDGFETAKAKLDESLSDFALLGILERKTGVAKGVYFFGGLFSLFTATYVLFGPSLICNLTGFLYPTYASFKAIESKRKDDDTQWLTYWVVFALLTVLEAFIELLLFWFPFYYSFKFGFLIWLFSPTTLGAKFVYNNIIRAMFFTAEDYVAAKFADESQSLNSKEKDE